MNSFLLHYINNMIKEVIEYENSMLKLKALADADDKEIDELMNLCVEYSKTTTNTVGDIAHRISADLMQRRNFKDIINELKNKTYKPKEQSLGLKSYKFWIKDYIKSGTKIPIEWIEEYNKLLGEQELKNEKNGYLLEDLKNIIELINKYPICANDVEIIVNHFLYLCEYKALHGKNLKRYLEKNFEIGGNN